MHKIHFYEDKDGNSPVFEYIRALSQRPDKDSRINHNKINDHIQVIKQVRQSRWRALYEAHRGRYMGT